MLKVGADKIDHRYEDKQSRDKAFRPCQFSDPLMVLIEKVGFVYRMSLQVFQDNRCGF
ncbi:uncharacterized protein METZ01_LOCUS232294 [marine metagenome]|uniref:Uncharacterized protein n=1 Tax=marine metagenome TaxID=408172 RepID=A0A382GWN0_9ZZZZ